MRSLKLLAFVLALAGFAFVACNREEDPLAAPTIAVVADNSSPFPGDKVKFSITVNAPGKLKSVRLGSTTVKSYTDGSTSDRFDYEFTVPATSALGPTSYAFTVEDGQSPTLTGTFNVAATVQNPDFRGNPRVLFNFNSPVPNVQVAELKFDSGAQPWEAAYKLTPEATDPANVNNKVLQADRLGAHEWFFQGGGAVFMKMAQPLSEDDVNGLISGTRVLQMNMYFKEIPKVVTVHKSPTNPDSTKRQVDLSWKFNNTIEGWDFIAQADASKAITVAIEVGNAEQWAWNNGNPLGKKFYLIGSITKANQWQTVTFSRRGLTGTPPMTMRTPLTQASTQAAALDDPAVALNKINYFAIIINNRKTGFPNPEGWFEMPGDGNNWSPNNVAGVSDDHNTYLIDNVRLIDAKDYDKNPN
jgi:hypothetical protein